MKLPRRLIGSIAIVCGFLALSPGRWLASVGLEKLVGDYRQYIALGFIVCSAILITDLLAWAFRKLNSQLGRKTQRKKMQHEVAKLDLAEICVPREFAIQCQSTVLLPVDNPVVAGLVQKRVLRQVGAMGRHMVCGVVFSFRVNEAAEALVTDDLLGFPATDDREAIEKIRRARPDFVLSILREQRLFNSSGF
jgi:hypothetical protein